MISKEEKSKLFQYVVDACKNLLNEFPQASQHREYLNSRINKQFQDKFEFGYFPDFHNIDVLKSVIDEKILLDLHLVYDKTIYEDLQPRIVRHGALEHQNLIMPYRDVYGDIVALVGRTIMSNDDLALTKIDKYKNTSFSKSHHLFGLNFAKDSILKRNRVYVVEGQFDCIRAHQFGLTNTVCVGSSSLSLFQLGLLKRYTTNICLLFDNDEGGESGRAKAIKKMGEWVDFKNIYLPKEYNDLYDYINDMPTGSGVEDLRFKIKTG